MKVRTISNTNIPNISEYIGYISGTCTNKSGKNDNNRAIANLQQGHMSVFEHMSFTWKIEGLSRACTHQLVRHRLASFTQESQRYVKLTDEISDWFVTPKSIIESGHEKDYKKQCKRAFKLYSKLIEDGVKAEDARYILPNATKTTICVTMNLREFLHFYKLRSDSHSQWEIQELAERMRYEIELFYPELGDYINIVCSKQSDD